MTDASDKSLLEVLLDSWDRKVAGRPMGDGVAGPVTWGVWMCEK